ncbi:MAG: AAA family ATPase [Thermoplasmata archaeon]
MEKITLRTRILIYLADYWKYKDRYQYPIEITQEGISRAVGITVSHVPRELDILMDNKLVEEIKGRVSGKEKRMNVYFLTYDGMFEVEKIKRSIGNENVHFNGKKYRIYDLVEIKREISWLEAIDLLLNESKAIKEKRKTYIEGNFENEIFDRKEELEFMNEWIKSPSPFLALIAPQGMGKTALIGKFISGIKNMEIMMIQINNQITIEKLKERIENVMNKDFEYFMKEEKNSLVIIDNYNIVDDSIVDYLQNLINEKKRGKIIVSMREETPSYNRFYKIDDVISGKVKELKLKGLSQEYVGKFLEITDNEIVKTIYQLTGGKPSILKAIKQKDEKEILNNSQLTPEQAKFLIGFLK